MKVISNNQPRPLVSFYDLPETVKLDFDYLTAADGERYNPRFFEYKGAWYDSQEFTRICKRENMRGGFCHGVESDSPLLKWDGIQTDTYFSGILVRYDKDDNATIIVGRCYS